MNQLAIITPPIVTGNPVLDRLHYEKKLREQRQALAVAKFKRDSAPKPKPVIYIDAVPRVQERQQRGAGASKYCEECGCQACVERRRQRAKQRILVADIAKLVCRKYGVTRSQIERDDRRFFLVQPRFEIYYLARKFAHSSYPEIGRILGGRDHTSVLSGVRRYQHYQKYKMEVTPLEQRKCSWDLEHVIAPGDEKEFLEGLKYV